VRALFASVIHLLALILDPTVWLDGADQPTAVSHPPSLEWHTRTTQHTLGAKAVEGGGEAPLSAGCAAPCVGAIQEKDGVIQVQSSSI
jgi:hypothetical protein